jgi:hypothetical protein
VIGIVCVAATLTGGTRSELPVRIVDPDRRPVSGAFVAAFEARSDGFATRDRESAEIDAIQSWIERGGAGAPSDDGDWSVTDGDGDTTVAMAAFWTDVVALTPTVSGHAIVVRGVERGADRVEITVAPHRYWRVPVVDPNETDHPPRVSVEFGIEGDLEKRDSFKRIARRKTEGPGNVATLGPVDLLLDPLAVDPTLVARLDLPIDSARRLRRRASEFDGPSPPLEIPPHGSLEVRIVDRSGAIVARPVGVEVRRDRYADPWSIWWLNSDLGTWTKRTESGIARFDIVGLDAALTLTDEDRSESVACDEHLHALDRRGHVPPLEKAGQRLSLTLLAADSPLHEVRVRGRAVDPGGNPLVRRNLSVDFCWFEESDDPGSRNPKWRRLDALSGADGSFESTLRLPERAIHRAFLVIGDSGPLGRRWYAPRAAKYFDIEAIEVWKGGDLGDVPLAPLELLVSGRTVDSEGNAIADLGVTLDTDEKALEQDDSLPSWWTALYHRPGTRSDRDGRFEIRGFGSKHAWKLTARGDEAQTMVAFPIDHGGTDSTVTCARGTLPEHSGCFGQIAGSLLLDPGVPTSIIDVSLDPRDEVQNYTYRLDNNCGDLPGARIGRQWIPARRWTPNVEFRAFGQESTVLAKLPIVTVERSRTSSLPPIDLRGRIKVKHLEIIDRDGRPIRGGYVISRNLRGDDKHRSEDFTYFHDGDALVATLENWPEFEFMAVGFRRVARRLDATDRETIVLPPALRVHASIPTGLRLPQAPLHLELRLRTDEVMSYNVGRTANPPNDANASFISEPTADLLLPAAATYEVSLSLTNRQEGAPSTIWKPVALRSDRRKRFLDTDETQTLEVDVSQESIDAVVKSLSR